MVNVAEDAVTGLVGFCDGCVDGASVVGAIVGMPVDGASVGVSVVGTNVGCLVDGTTRGVPCPLLAR